MSEARERLDRRAVVAAAAELVDRDGAESLTMTRLAKELRVRAPSLYEHVSGQQALRRELWLWAVADLGERLRASVMGRSGVDAFRTLASQLREYALEHPGRYRLTLEAPVPLDEECARARRRANEAFDAAVRAFELPRAEAVRVGRALRAAVHGFVSLEATGGLRGDTVDDSFRWLLDVLVRAAAGRPVTVDLGAGVAGARTRAG